ncbi:hypothetical protein [Streptomyces sp. 11-1-2]|uniref:hypothetical protein n=1 Tax=unclassified Streptomyces TaxID=2593676 RepID=UPI0013C4DAB8|nr:hypothetical protein [Streptomyces sp. 11-1-2]
MRAQATPATAVVHHGGCEQADTVSDLMGRADDLEPSGDHLTPADCPSSRAPGRAEHQRVLTPLACTSRLVSPDRAIVGTDCGCRLRDGARIAGAGRRRLAATAHPMAEAPAAAGA